MKPFMRFFVALCLVSAIAGCKKKDAVAEEEIHSAESVSESNFSAEVAREETQVSEADATPAAVAPDSPVTQNAASNRRPFAETKPSKTTADKAHGNNVEGDRIDDMFIYKMTLKRVVPEDYLIGPLENLQNSDYRVTQILKTINTFFRDLRSGTLNESCLHPSAVQLISSAFRFYLDEEAIPDVIRIGKTEITGKSARINLRFYRGNGVTDGEIILEESNVGNSKQWLITDCQADLMQILDPYKPSDEPFQPGAYNFYNWE